MANTTNCLVQVANQNEDVKAQVAHLEQEMRKEVSDLKSTVGDMQKQKSLEPLPKDLCVSYHTIYILYLCVCGVAYR